MTDQTHVDYLCGRMLGSWVCRKPQGHDGPHCTGPGAMGESVAMWEGGLPNG